MKWFNDLKTRTKLLSSYFLVSVISVIIGYIGIVNLNDLNNRNNISYRKGTLGVIYIANMSTAFQKMRSEVRNILLCEYGKEEKYISSIKTLTDEFQKNSELYENAYFNEENKKLHESLKNLWTNYISRVDIFIKLATANKKVEAKEYMTSVITPGNAELHQIMQKMIDNNNQIVKNENEENIRTSATTQNEMGGVIVVGFLLNVFLGLYVSKSMVLRPVEGLMNTINNSIFVIGSVDSQNRTKDELKRMSNTFTQIVKGQKNLVLGFLQKLRQVSASSEILLEISQKFANSSQDLNARVDTAAASSEQISANVNTVSASAEEMTASIKEISKNTSTAAKFAQEAQDNANNASEVIAHLGDSSSEIGNIVKEITSIAEQTNLLALNATIEAARAGESGKGFAVVANEVKELAKQAAKASEDITSKIKMVQSGTDNAIKVIKGIIENTKKINDITNSIASAVEEQTVTTNEVNRNLSEATKGVSSIVEVISAISNATKEFAKESSSVKSTSTELQTLVNELHDELEKNYKVSIYKFIENAITAHNLWKKRLQKAIEGGEIPDESKAGADNVCDFGKWIYGEGLKYRDHDEYEDLKSKHAHFHTNASKIISLIKKGEKDKAISELNFGEFAKISTDVVSSIRKFVEIV